MINGSYLRKLRKSNNYTLTTLSQEIGCTASFLSQLERGQKEPSLATLRKLSEVLHSPMSAFFQPDEGDGTHFSPEDTPRFSVVHREGRAILPAQQRIARCEVLTPSMEAKCGSSLEGSIAYLQPGTFCAEKIIVHADRDEILHVIRGNVTAYLDSEEIPLRTGDTVYINAGTSHNFYNGSDDEAILLSAIGR